MNATYRILSSFVILAILGLTSVLSAATIVSSDLVVSAGDGAFTILDNHINPSLLPSTPSNSISDGLSNASANYTLSENSFRVDFTGYRAGTEGSFAAANGSIGFLLATPANYTVTGELTITHDSTASNVEFGNYVFGGYLFSRQVSNFTVNEFLSAGGSGGDTTNLLLGSVTGSLPAGNNSWGYLMTTVNFSEDTGAIISGFAQIDLTPIPEPSTLVSLGLGATSLLCIAYRRRRKLKLAGLAKESGADPQPSPADCHNENS